MGRRKKKHTATRPLGMHRGILGTSGAVASDRSQVNICHRSSTRRFWTVTLIASPKWPRPTDRSPTSTKVRWPTLEAGAGGNKKMVTGVSGAFLRLKCTAFHMWVSDRFIVYNFKFIVPGFCHQQLRLFDLDTCPLEAGKDA